MFDPIVGNLKASLRARNTRQEVITGNLANADTPGYRSKRVEFEAELNAMVTGKAGTTMTRTDGGHISAGGKQKGIANVQEADSDLSVGLDGNSVSRETEMARMAENQMLYRASAKALARHLAMVRYAIAEGGK